MKPVFDPERIVDLDDPKDARDCGHIVIDELRKNGIAYTRETQDWLHAALRSDRNNALRPAFNAALELLKEI